MGGKDVEVEWMPFELRPFPAPTLRPEGDYLQTAWGESVYPLAGRMGERIVLPRVSPQPYTHLAFEGYQHAKERGKGREYNHRVFTAFFQEEQDIGDVAVLARLAGEVGLDAGDFQQALKTRTYKAAHQRALEHAYREARVTMVPTFAIGGRVLEGLHGRRVLERVIDEELRARAAAEARGLACGPDGCD